MALLTWDQVLSSPDYGNQINSIMNARRLQNRAIPQAAPEIKQATLQEGARLSRLQQMGGELDIANRRLGLKRQELGMEQQDLSRYARRLPLANLISAGNVAIGGLSAYGNLAAARRSEERGQQGMAFQREGYEAQRQFFENERRRQEQMGQTYRPLADLYKLQP